MKPGFQRNEVIWQKERQLLIERKGRSKLVRLLRTSVRRERKKRFVVPTRSRPTKRQVKKEEKLLVRFPRFSKSSEVQSLRNKSCGHLAVPSVGWGGVPKVKVRCPYTEEMWIKRVGGERWAGEVIMEFRCSCFLDRVAAHYCRTLSAKSIIDKCHGTLSSDSNDRIIDLFVIWNFFILMSINNN